MKKILDCKVVSVSWLNDISFILTLSTDQALEEIKPGNFAQIQAPGVFLRRPFSILDADPKQMRLEFFVKAIGPGTRSLGSLANGTRVNIIYPLGNSFTEVSRSKVLIVGGGSGIAPFILLGKHLNAKENKITYLIGGRKASDILLTDSFGKYGDVLITTEDGSLGEKGRVTQHFLFLQGKLDFDMIYTCGPDPMMKAVQHLSEKAGIPCEASLENLMACGFGACLCCVVPTEEGHKCVCTDGPVFNVSELRW